MDVRTFTQDSPKWNEAIDDAVGLLARGGVVLLPCETLPAYAAAVGEPKAIERLWQLKGNPEQTAVALHFATHEEVDRALAGVFPITPAHHRLIDRFCPGPVQLLVPLGEQGTKDWVQAHSIPQGLCNHEDALLLRVPDHPVAHALLSRTGQRVVMASASLPDGTRPGTISEIMDHLQTLPDDAPRPDLVLDCPPKPAGSGSTLVRLNPNAGVTVMREGLVDERYVLERMARTVLFVCTGNTCRSPMAAAIAKDVVEQAALQDPGGSASHTVVRSAGTNAIFGVPMTTEAQAALSSMGIDSGEHESMPLTKEMIAEADVIYAMTASHRRLAQAIDPTAASRIQLLDPAGGDVSDPIGRGDAVYKKTASQVHSFISKRLDEILGTNELSAERTSS